MILVLFKSKAESVVFLDGAEPVSGWCCTGAFFAVRGEGLFSCRLERGGPGRGIRIKRRALEGGIGAVGNISSRRTGIGRWWASGIDGRAEGRLL